MAVTKQVEKKKPTAAKPVKGMKKTKEKKPQSTKTAAHPPYFEMIKEALMALNERSGSSPHAIAKYMEEKHKSTLPVNFRKVLGLQLKNSTIKGKLIKIKASYKLSDSIKKAKPAAAITKKPKTAKAMVAKKAESVKKATTPKKVAVVKAKKPKSIKSPAVRKAMKMTAV